MRPVDDLPRLFEARPRATPPDAIRAADWAGPPPGSVLVAVRRPVPHGRAAPAVFFVPDWR